MESLSSLELGLSVLFGCLFLALVAEVYYLAWWKRRLTERAIEEEEDDDDNPSTEILYILCCNSKRKSFSQELKITVDNQSGNQLHHQTSKELYLFDENCLEDADFMVGLPPRFLFTIKEETKEDLESEDGKSKVGRSKLSDLMQIRDTPFATPVSSPAFFTPPLTPSMASSHKNGYNPFCESISDMEFINMKSTPPPLFKFLRDADEKLRRKITAEEGESVCKDVHTAIDITTLKTNFCSEYTCQTNQYQSVS